MDSYDILNILSWRHIMRQLLSSGNYCHVNSQQKQANKQMWSQSIFSILIRLNMTTDIKFVPAAHTKVMARYPTMGM